MFRSPAPARPARPRLSPLGPGGRPFARWRPVLALVALGTALVGGVVLLSDRAPGLLARLSARIDAGSSRAARLASETRPQSDFELHIAASAAITVLVGLAMWSNRSVLISAMAVFAVSVIAERAQEVLTTSRELQFGDVAGNLIGVMAGLGAVMGLATLFGWRDP